MKAAGDIEFSSRKEIHALQEQKLKKLLKYVGEHSPFYQRVFKEHSIRPGKISLKHLSSIPFTTKDELSLFNDDFLCVPKNQVADFVTTSGTTSAPITFYLTAKDLERLAYNEEISLRCAGGKKNSVYQLMTTIDKQFMAGLAYYLGIRNLGAGIIRVGPGSPFLQWESIRKFSPTSLIAIPSFIPKLIQHAIDHGIDYQSTSVESIICIGEPIRNPDFSLNELGKRIDSQWKVKLFSTYASTEMGSAFTECDASKGGHHHPELLILEVVDEAGHPVAEGTAGEVVVTTLGVEGMPLLRYKTGDLCHVYYEKCACGRKTARLGPVMGRKQQMIKYKGTTLFPPAIFDVMDMVKEIDLYQVQVSKDEFSNDRITIVLDQEIQSPQLENELHALFKSKLRVTPDFSFISKATLNDKIFNSSKRKPEKIIYI